MARLLPALTPPTTPAIAATEARDITFRHPAYPDTEPPLLQLCAVDGSNRDGLDYDTGFLACCIVTGNKWQDGWLARKGSDGSYKRVDRPDDGILVEDVYYFCLDPFDPKEKYPVLPSFDHWRFPHDDIPYPWSALQIDPAPGPRVLKQKLAAIARDGTCRISGYLDATEVARLVPASAGQWFSSNKMDQYCRFANEPLPINDEKNLVLLRKDLHYLFDQRRFTFLARQSGDNQKPVQLVTHVLLPQDSAEFIGLYHSRATQPLRGVSVELLFARFAWSIFADENFPLLTGYQQYAVSLFNPKTGETTTDTLQSTQILETISLFGAVSIDRKVSPRKRLPAQSIEDDDHLSEIVDYDQDDSDDPDKNEYDEEMELRGRRRERS
ncbi:hypothetical protein PT974_01539 [Cladobotryum mycophilum]|uniref:HNH nuclease domain-containing protein n=1 Tax=Cladobotryum mycophilum TaxID=491253 RepID=A0ABR0T528_9HYPO